MKSTLILAAALTGIFANPVDHFHTWSPQGPGDVRSPCPGLNTLANHGFLPHDGKNIDLNTTIAALNGALNGDPVLITNLFKGAVKANLATPNATTFSLDDLNHHNIVEHDASMSRGDYYFGDDHTFNQTIFSQTRSHWNSETIDVQIAANARVARIATSNATNQTFNTTFIADKGFGEPSAYLLALGNLTIHTVNRAYVEYLFEHERLPLELGWRRSDYTFTWDDYVNTMRLISDASPNGLKPVAGKEMRAIDIHSF